ncbi:MAG: hypothetical protein U1E26_02860 [Coriobacteriia bacterium]|nr:hypothetical protein [Coriobacteriia bacterium]
MLANPWIRLTNNWLHDVSSGLWAACVLVIWVLQQQKEALGASAGPEFVGALLDVQWIIFWLLVAALVVIALTGGVRLAYWRAQTPPEEMGAKRPALIGKHIVFLVVYGGGTVWAYLLFTAGT